MWTSNPFGLKSYPVFGLVAMLGWIFYPSNLNAALETRPEHVVLISIDGLRPEFYLDGSWPAPMIQQMAREGAHAKTVRSVFPSVTYPSHTTLVTGVLPSSHGIYYNSPFEPEGQTGRWYWEASSIRVPTLWDALRRSGRKSAAVSWPVSVGAPIDWNIPEVWSLDRDDDPIEPIRATTTPVGLLAEIEREATGRLRKSDFRNDYFGRDDRSGLTAAYLLEQYRPTLLAVHLVASDHFQHAAGRESPLVRRALAAADRAVSRIVEAAERAGLLETTAFVVTGDHGFVDTHTLLAPNVWLAREGLMEARRDRGDWSATFHTTGGAALLHLRRPEDYETQALIRQILDSLPAHIRRQFRVIERDQLDQVGADPQAFLALSAIRGTSFSSSPREPDVRPARGGNHGYFPDFDDIHTGFIGWGKGFRSKASTSQLKLEDIAPLIARLLDLKFETPDGTAPSRLEEIED